MSLSERGGKKEEKSERDRKRKKKDEGREAEDFIFCIRKMSKTINYLLLIPPL